ncbi:hypothetical protein [Halomonas nitroreducens]|uniref:Bacteriophage tail tape measure N-terminal domain-containing protein n=1 Tax=Halomonas nitroreducens TaxID=447425 RepID=A0A431V1B2_9GAMM|nr:hypothetical protein [Halomonas nitroreducens]RTR01936.1 hypothetical protein EKG36_13080 [Halomonas nitroreducens]
MASQYKAGLIITGDASGGIKAIQATDKQLQALNRDFTQGGRKARQFGQDANRAGNDVRGLTQNVHSAGEGLAVLKRAAVPVGAAIASMFAAGSLRAQVDFADQLQKINLRIGASTEALSQYNYVASLSDVQFKELTTAWQRQSRRVAQAAQDTGEAQEALAALNLDAGELAKLAPEQQFERIAAAMNGVASEAQRVALAQKIWDSEGVKLLQIVNQGTDAIARMRAEADALGLTISQQTANDMATFNDEMARLSFAAEGVSKTLLAEVVPAMTDGLQATSAFLAEAGGAEAVLGELVDIGGALALVYGGKLALAIGAKTAATIKAAEASMAAAQADVRATQVGVARAAENLRVAQSEQAAAQRALANAQATTAATGSTTNRTRALAALAVANQKAMAAEASHTAAVNTQAAAMTRASVAARGASMAVRGYSGAMMLLGGPAGAAILAAGAVFYFRDELGLTIPTVDASAAAVAQLTGELDGMNRATAEAKLTQLTTQLADLKAAAEETGEAYLAVGQDDTGAGGFLGADVAGQVEQIREIGEAAGPARQEMANVEEAIGLVKDRLEQLGDEGERTPPTLTKIGDAAKEAEKAAREQADALEALRQAMNPMRAEATTLAERVAVLDQGLADGTVGVVEHAQGLAWAAEEYMRAATGAEEYEKRTEALVSQYDRSAQKAAQLEQALADLNERYRAGELEGGPEQYRRMVAAIREEMAELSREADPMAQEMARAWEEATKRIDATFADAFQGAFESFDDFADQLLDGFKRLLAELAYQATLKPIVLNITGQMGGTLGIPGTGGGMAGGGGMGGTGKLLSTGKQLYNGLTGGGGIAWTGASNAAYSGGFAGSATSGMGQSGFMGGSTANFQGMNGLASAGAGYVGTRLGGEVFGETQTGQHLGTAGALIGTYFGGPVGAAIGSFIGSSIGSAFADKYAGENPTGTLKTVNEYGAAGRSGFEREAVAESALGRVGFARESRDIDTLFGDRDNFENAKKFAQQVAATDNAIAQLARSEAELAEMREAAADQGLSSMDDLEGRYRAILSSLDGTYGDFVASLEGGVEAIVAQAVPARQALVLLADGVDALNLRFREGSVASYRAAGHLAELMGGVEALAGAQQSYYQAFVGEAERRANLEADLGDAFAELNLEMPDTAAQFRDLVEAQNLMTEAGREQYAALLKLAPSMSEYLTAMEQQHAQMRGFIDSLLLSDQSTLDPGERLRESQAQYAQLRDEVRQLRAERSRDAGQAADQRAQQLREQQGIHRNTRNPVSTV